MPEQEYTNYTPEVTVEETAKPKKDLTNVVGAGAIAVGAVTTFEVGKFLFKKAKKGIVKLAGKIEAERDEADKNGDAKPAGNESED